MNVEGVRRRGRSETSVQNVDEEEPIFEKKPPYLYLLAVFSLLYGLYVISQSSRAKLLLASYNDDECGNFTPQKLIGIYGHNMKDQYTRPINSSCLETQLLFDQGMIHLFGYNNIEARRNFRSAIELDRYCVMCYWGLAYSFGPNINTVISDDDVVAGKNAIYEAMKLIKSAPESPVKDLVLSLDVRFAESINEWVSLGQNHFDKLYATAMEKVYARYGSSDADIAALYAAALIDLSPWYYFNPNGSKLLPFLEPAVEALLTSLKLSSYKEPLALHLYIHITEQSPTPLLGEIAADSLAKLADKEGTSHLIHMPAHTYIRIGRFQDSIASSEFAVALDDYYVDHCLDPYVPFHNKAILVMSALSNGRMNTALDYSFSIFNTQDLAAVYLSGLFPTPIELIYCRFGKWMDITRLLRNEDLNIDDSTLNRELLLLAPEKRLLSSRHSRLLFSTLMKNRPPYLQMMRIYVSVLSFLGMEMHHHCRGDLSFLKPYYDCSTEASIQELALNKLQGLSKAVSKVPFDGLPISHIFYPYHHELGQLMNATAYSSYYVGLNDFDSAGMILKDAIRLQDSFSYMEPENFYLPLRQCLGAVHVMKARKMNQQRQSLNININKEEVIKELEKARDIFFQDLKNHPFNAWSLRGLIQALTMIKSLSDENVIELISPLPLSSSANANDSRYLRSFHGEQESFSSYWHQDIGTMSILELTSLLEVIWRGSDSYQGSCCELGLC